jgi:hypothetical protein
LLSIFASALGEEAEDNRRLCRWYELLLRARNVGQSPFDCGGRCLTKGIEKPAWKASGRSSTYDCIVAVDIKRHFNDLPSRGDSK